MGKSLSRLFSFPKHSTNNIPTKPHLCYNLPKEHYMVMALTYKNKENMPVYPGTEPLKLQNNNHSPIRAIAWFE